ncbi:FK506-binding protein 5-like [Penaeus japonicus]|uniref:FK506-binding protein 5-like n=1 Tax=Penaeus japonicus TaxID=27405 RepID=UPI001C7151E7|nr:FK506-binding protein 5-like [Penaeus japonicus]
MSSRRTIRMKLRKKALETKRLRKTRHSDRVKENVLKPQEKGKEEGGKEKEKKIKDESLKIQGKKGKEETVREEEKEEENPAKGKKVKSKNPEGNGESSTKDKEKKDKFASIKGLKDEYGDSESDSAKKITRRRGSAEQPKQSKQTKSVIDKVNQKVLKKKQAKGESSELVTNIKELSTKSTSETVDVLINAKVTKKKSKYLDVSKDVLLDEKKLQALKKVNGVVGLSDRELQPVCKIKELKGKTKAPGGKVGRKAQNQISSVQVGAEQNSQKKINDKKEQSAKKNIENMRKSGINKVAMLTGKKVKGSRAMLDTTIVKASKKISKKKQEAMEAGVPLEKEVVSLPAPVEEKGVMMQKKNVKGKKYLTEKKSATTKKKSAPHDKLNTDEESREGLEQNLKYNPEKAPEAIELDGTKFDKDAIKKNVYLISSSEETADESDDSEPEVSRNFRTGRRCGGRMGLRNKRKPQNQRYSFRSCLDPEETENDKDEREIVKDSMVIKTNIEETKDELPLTPKRKRKIANYEDDDDFTYMPSGNSTDLEEESSDGVEVLGKEVSTSLRKRRKTTLPSSDSDGHMPARRASLQRRGSALTSEGETPDDSYDENATKTSKASLALDVSNNSKVLIERKIPKKKNMRLQCLVSQVMKSEDKFERLGQKGPKKNRESKSSIIISEDEKKTSGKIRVRKLANTTDESQESESTVDEDYIGKTSLIPVSSKRKKTAKKPVPSLIPLGEASMADNICRYDDDDDDDDEDNIPLATIAQLKGRSLPRRIAMSNIIKEKVKSVAVRSKKLASGVQKHLPRQVMDTGTADSESSGFEGFVPVSVKKNKRRIGLKHKSKIMAPMAASENEVDTSSNTEISSSPKPKRKCTAAKKIENNATEILVSKSTKDKTKIFYTKAGDEEKTNAFSMQSTKADQSSTNLETKAQQSSTNVKSDTKKTRKYVRKSTEAVAAMPVLEPVNWQEAGSETPSTDTGDILSSSEGDASQKQPAKVRRRRSSVEKIKDIPTRSSAILLHENMTPPDLKAVSTSDTVHETSLLENIQPVWENKVPVPSKPRKRRTKSSHELLPQTESAVNAPQENTVVSNVDGGKAPKKTKRKRASSMSNMSGAEAEKVVRMKSPLRVNTGEASKNVSAKSPKKNSEGQKRKKNAHKDDMHDLKCVDCGLRFGSVASLEDHQQDCVTIAFEMSLMEAEDHLFECPHCHLTFALKGTQRKHTTSCRLAKSRKTPHRGEMKAMKRMNRTTAPPQEPLLPDATDSSIVANPCQGAPIKSRRRSKENVASDEGVNAASPLKDSFKQNFVNISEVADKSDSEKQLEKTKKLAPVPYSRSNSKVRKELQTNGQLENFEGVDLFCLTKIDGVQKCSVCGYEVMDKESVDKHRLLQQFTHHCQQKTVLEVCALLTNYNLSIDTVRTLITSASILHGSTVLNLDAKQQSYLEGNSVTTVSASNCALQLKELLTSPHCTRILSVLDTIATHHRTSRTVSISGTRQEALKAVSALEELLKEISEIDNSIKKNRMLKSMRETFEAGTIN